MFPPSMTLVDDFAFRGCSNLKNRNQIDADIALINKRDGSWKAEWTRRMAKENQITAKLCISCIHSSDVARARIIYSALNDLTEGDFVKVDMIKTVVGLVKLIGYWSWWA